MLSKEDRTEVKKIVRHESGLLMGHIDDKFERIKEAIDSMRESLEAHTLRCNERMEKFEREMAFMRGDIGLHDNRITKLESS